MPRSNTGNRAQDPVKALKRLLSIIFAGRKKDIVFILIAIAISASGTVITSVFFGYFIDSCVLPMLENGFAWAPILKTLASYAAMVAFAVIFSYLLHRKMVDISQDTLYSIRTDMFRKLESLPISYFDRNAHGNIMSRFSNDTDTLSQLISNSIVVAMQSVMTVLLIAIAMLVQSPLLTLVVALFSGLTFLAVRWITKRSGIRFKAQQRTLGAVNGFIEEMMKGQRVVKVFTHEQESISDFDKLNADLYENMSKANTLANIMGPVTMNIGNLQYVALVIIGAIGAISFDSASLTLGTLAAFLQLSRAFANNINQIAQQSNIMLQALAGAERIFDLLDQESEKDEGYVTLVNSRTDENGNTVEVKERSGEWAWKHPHHDGTLTYTPLRGDIVMDHVDFGYTEDKIVLHDVSLYADPGDKIAFVGATGAGKTTITNLLNRFYDIQDGKIRFDGININKIRKSDLRRSLGMILQDTNLFTGTVRDNIRFGKLDATDDEIVAAAKLANAHDFIMMMPEGYDTVLTGNGENLSQGQRQLLSIARAAVADSPVLVMDEATSSIDTNTERLVQDGMDKLMAGRTVFVIAHRLSTVRNSNAIMVLDHGRIIERGTHEDLMALKGAYYRLCTGETELD